jgi:uncharacterized repeat protein (TIGR03803 family)
VKGELYGTTNHGGAGKSGAAKGGAVFSLDPDTSVETALYSSCSEEDCADGESPSAGVLDVNGTLYGTAIGGGAYDGGVVFALDPATGAETVIHSFGSGTDGEEPEAGLTDLKGTLYGTTVLGGARGEGTVFSITP